ncbi:MAG: tetratricopeptide repeat protein [Oscillospiraceae bacterium]|nr:tetratricopeptide repeat protein [Oscillospiraceae bacterium]
MQCDFQNVTDTLLRNLASSTTVYYINLLNTLFAAYLADAHIYQFERFTSAKLRSGMIRVSPEMSEFYLNADREVLCKDIAELLPYIFDQPNTYKELYDLIQYDDTLSAPLRKEILSRIPAQYADNTSLVNMIYEAVFIAVTRQYEKADKGYVATRYAADAASYKDALFANSEFIAPCRHFCGRDAELNELHSLVQDNSTVLVTGVAGIGKSELVRAYAERHKSEYAHFGYYFYKGSLKTIIANIIINPLITDENERYRRNMELLASLGKSVLLIIDNFNASPDEDDCFYDLLDLNCGVIFTSHRHYDDFCVYELTEFRSKDLLLKLIGKFCEFKSNEKSILLNIIDAVDRHTFCVELCARLMYKGFYTPKSLSAKLSGGLKSILERFSATKDKHPKKKTCYDHIRDLFGLLELPEAYRNVLRMLIVSPCSGIRKDAMAVLMCLDNMVMLDELVELGLVHEFANGTITLHPMLRTLVKSELNPDSENCAPLISSVRAVCINEQADAEIDAEKMLEMIDFAVRDIEYRNQREHFSFVSDCFEYADRAASFPHMDSLLRLEKHLLDKDDTQQNALYLSESAACELHRGNYPKALALQEEAVKYAMQCNDTLLQANVLSTYGFCLHHVNRKEEALKVLEQSLALFGLLDGDGVFYFDKYRAMITFADVLFTLGRTDEAVALVSIAERSLQEMNLTHISVYADCKFSLGIYHLCLHNAAAADDLVCAFRILIDLYGTESDLVRLRRGEAQKYIAQTGFDLTKYAPLMQLLEG